MIFHEPFAEINRARGRRLNRQRRRGAAMRRVSNQPDSRAAQSTRAAHHTLQAKSLDFLMASGSVKNPIGADQQRRQRIAERVGGEKGEGNGRSEFGVGEWSNVVGKGRGEEVGWVGCDLAVGR